MKRSAPVNKLSRRLLWLSAVIILLMPFHAFLTVWLSSLMGHYTLLRLWKEFLLAPITLGAIYKLYADKSLARRFFSRRLVQLIMAYILLAAVCAGVAYGRHDVSAKAMWYGLLVDLRFLIFFLAVCVLAAGDRAERDWRKILLGPAIIVAAFAILQFWVLPYDFLKHFGYGDSTIGPYETINHNLAHIRVASTLRGANPLGAYLILPISALAVMYFRRKDQRWNILAFTTGLILALIFSFSRSAWIGAGLAAAAAIWLSLKSARARLITGWVAAAIAVLAAILTIALRNNLTFENLVFHTDRTSKAASSSDQGHAAAFKAAVHDVIHQPLGGGVGTAGPQSVYNNHPGRIAENYYLQIGQETGILGALLFISIITAAALELFKRRSEPLALTLLASLIGISLVGLLSHVWSDDTLAYVWWGLAALAMAPALTMKNT